MLPLVKELRWKEVRDGLTENPDLIGVRDKRGSNMVAPGLWRRYHKGAGRRGPRQYQTSRDPS
jgi:hypothetical protein